MYRVELYAGVRRAALVEGLVPRVRVLDANLGFTAYRMADVGGEVRPTPARGPNVTFVDPSPPTVTNLLGV